MHDAGILKLYSLQNINANGRMPKEMLVEEGRAYYIERTIGVTRAYSAMAAKQRIDELIRVFNTDIPINSEYVILENGLQYRIELKQIAGDNTDLTLTRLEELLDVYSGENSND